jgi:hypothetical protein
LAGTRNLVPLRRQLSTAVTCWVVPNLSALVGQPTLNVGIDSDSGRSSNRTGGYCSRRTNAVKFRRVEPNLSAHLRACPLVRVQPSGRTRQVAHTWTGRDPYVTGLQPTSAARQYRRSRYLGSHFGETASGRLCASGGVVVAQRGSAIPQATLLYCWRFDRSLVTGRRTLLPGVSTRLRPPSGCTDANQGRVAIAKDLSAAMDPGAGEAAARRCSSVTVKDEGLCQTLVHRPIRRM